MHEKRPLSLAVFVFCNLTKGQSYALVICSEAKISTFLKLDNIWTTSFKIK